MKMQMTSMHRGKTFEIHAVIFMSTNLRNSKVTCFCKCLHMVL